MNFNMNRRTMLKAGAAATAMTAFGVPALAAPKKGGTLRLGLSGANTSDSWDGRTHSDSFMINSGHGCVFDCLTEIGADGTLKGELAESWEASPDAVTWTINLRKGVTFHNGKDFTADDAIASLQMHVAEGAKSAAKPIVAPIEEMTKTDTHQIQLKLKAGNAGFMTQLSDYHLLMYPGDDIEGAIANGIGTGLYKVDNFDPGVRFVGSRYADHYKGDSAGHFDSVEVIAINDSSARTNALMTGQIDAMSRIDFKTEALLKANPMVKILEVTGNQHYTFPMLTNLAPYDNVNVRRALKHAINRQEMVDKILQGHGRVANDHPIGPANEFFADDLPQNEYDPDKAAFYLKEAGMDSLAIDLSAANAAFAGAVDAAQLYQASAKPSGIDINVVQEPDDGYWSNVWLKKAFCACYWGGRATEDWMFSTAYETGVPWNDTFWDNERFQSLLLQARSELDKGKARDMYTEMQSIMSQEGGTVVAMYANYVDAYSAKLAHEEAIGNNFLLDGSRITERWWFA